MSITAEQLQQEATQSTVVKSTPIKAVVTGTPSSVRTKQNDVKFVYLQVQLTEGKASGCIVLGTRTVLNSKGESKNIPKVGDEVIAYHTKLPSREIEGEFVHFFEIAPDVAITDNATLSALL